MKIRTVLSACYKLKERLKNKVIIFFYSRYMKRLTKKVSCHRPVRILFYVYNLPMWKSDRLLSLLLKDSRFEPIIVSYPKTSDSPASKRKLEIELSTHFGRLSANYMSGFDFEKNELYPVSKFNADIVFYPQPYKNKLKEMPRKVLLAYIPYCFEMDNMKRITNTLYQNLCWKYFVSTSLHKELKIRQNYNKGSNVVVTGYPLADDFYDGHTPSADMWPSANPDLKRIIWAPHHTIRPKEWLDYSNFLDIAEQMIEIATKYKDKVQFIFKPHPLLKEKLYNIPSWGVERTDAYYDRWLRMPNCNLAEGDYVDLFMTSDALIHDCSSFKAEYLYVNKPVMYFTMKERFDTFNSFAMECYKVHYHGSTIADMESFIDNVIDGVDPLYDKRTKFICDYIKPTGNTTVAENIYDELCKIFE